MPRAKHVLSKAEGNAKDFKTKIKFQARNPKFETNLNIQTTGKFKTSSQTFVCRFDISCFGLYLFRILRHGCYVDVKSRRPRVLFSYASLPSRPRETCCYAWHGARPSH